MTNLIKKYWEKYATLGTSDALDVQENTKIRLMNLVYLFCMIGFFVSFLLRIFAGYYRIAFLGPFIPFSIFLTLPFLSYWNRPKLGWHIASIVIPLGITFAATQRPVLHANYLIYGTITFLLIYLHDDNRKIQLSHLLFTTLNVIAFAILSQQPSAAPVEQFPITITLIIILIALVANYLIINISFDYRKNREEDLAKAISLKEAALNANKDATLIVSTKGKITGYNKKYVEMWDLGSVFETEDIKKITKHNLSKVVNKKEILVGLKTIEKELSLETFHIINLLDGRTIESHTQPQIFEGGNCWSRL